MLLGELPDVLAGERAMAGQQLLIDDGEAILIAELRNFAGIRFGSGIKRRHAAHEAGGRMPFETLDQPEVGDLDAIADDEQVVRLDVEMLQLVLLVVHEVERLGCVGEIAAASRSTRDADQAGALAFREEVVERALGQLHDDDELAADVLAPARASRRTDGGPP